MACNKETFIKEYAEQIICGKASLFIGSGISRKAGYIGWKDLLKECAEEIDLDVDKEQDLITLAQFYVADKNRTKINKTITESFRETIAEPTVVHKIIANLPLYSIWTTNYDTLIERSLKSVNKQYSVITNDKSYTAIDRKSNVIVHKIHGDMNSPAECTITRQDYESFEREHDIVLAELKGEMCSRSFLFLGYGFKDTDIQHILSRIRLAYDKNNPQRHFCIIEKEKEGEDYEYRLKRQTHYIKDMESYNINVVLVDSYDEIDEIMKNISKKIHLNNVFISGAYEDSQDLRIIATSFLANEISKKLITEDYRIYSGYGKNMGADMVSGAYSGCGACGTKVKRFNDNVMLYPFPYNLPEDVNRKAIYYELRKNIISNTGISIFICGEKLVEDNLINSPGCIEEYHISRENGNLIIPIAITGGAAKEIWELERNDNGPSSKYDEFIELGTEKDANKIIQLVFNLIDKYIRENR